MNFKNKLLLIKTINFILIISLLLFSYWHVASKYKVQVKKELRNSIENKQNNLELLLKSSLETLKNNKKIYIEIHQQAVDSYKNNPNISLHKIKQKIAERHRLLSPNDFDIHLINRDKIVYDSTLENDIGYDLSQFSATAKTIDKAFETDDIQVPEHLSQDILNFNYKIYSYVRVDNDKLLEMSFIDKSTSEVFKSFELDSRPQLSHVDIEYFQIYKEGDKFFYIPKTNQNAKVKKQDLLEKATYFGKDSIVSTCSHCTSNTGISNQSSTFKDQVANAFIQDKPMYIEDESANLVTMYSKLLTTDSVNTSTEYKNIVVKYQVSMSERDTFLTSLRLMYLWVVFIAVLFIYLIHLFINKQLFTPINLITDSIKQGKAIPLATFKNHNDEFYIISHEYNKIISNLKNDITASQRMANIDPVTQIGNRKMFNENVQQLINDYGYTQKPFSLIMFNIDDFKKVNDEYGYLFGDTILKDLCVYVLDVIRNSDSLYRIGGGYFVVLLPNAQVSIAEHIAEKIRLGIQTELKKTCLQKYEQIKSHDKSYFSIKKITMSAGVSQVLQDDDYESLFTRLETLLYSAKEDGENKVKVG